MKQESERHERDRISIVSTTWIQFTLRYEWVKEEWEQRKGSCRRQNDEGEGERERGKLGTISQGSNPLRVTFLKFFSNDFPSFPSFGVIIKERGRVRRAKSYPQEEGKRCVEGKRGRIPPTSLVTDWLVMWRKRNKYKVSVKKCTMCLSFVTEITVAQ